MGIGKVLEVFTGNILRIKYGHDVQSGWWFEDTSGWYPYSQWQKINGNWYYFDYDGYMVTNKNIDRYWIGADGICQYFQE